MTRNEEVRANIFSRLVFWWMQPLIAAGYKKPLDHDDLYELYPGDDTATAYDRFQTKFAAERERLLRRSNARQQKKAKKQGAYRKLSESDASKEALSGSKDGQPKVKLWKVIYHVMKARWWFSGFLLLMYQVFAFVGPFGINYIVTFAEDPSTALFGGDYFGIYAVLIITAARILQSLCLHHHYHILVRDASRIRSSMISLIYRKSLRMPHYVKAELTEGKVSTLMSVDTETVMENCIYLHWLWTSPIAIAVALYLLVNFLGTAAGLGALVMVLFVPVQMWLVFKYENLSRRILAAKDKRVDLITEIMKGIRILKYYAWESSYKEIIEKYRKKEVSVILKKAFVRAASDILYVAGPTLMALCSFLLFALLEERELDPATAFTAFSLFHLIAGPFQALPEMLASIIDAGVSLSRVQAFLNADNLPELTPLMPVARMKTRSSDDGDASKRSSDHMPKRSSDPISKRSSDPSDYTSSSTSSRSSLHSASFGTSKPSKFDNDRIASLEVGSLEVGSILIERGEFRWEMASKRPTIKNIDLHVRPGELVMVIGKVGSGKSSLLSAILGEMIRSEPCPKHESFCGSVAYAAQLPWILNLTVKDNILFGRPFDRTLYDEVLKASGLEQDLGVLPGGDLTEIGERGINLSGGQKQRISIARALYAECDIYLLDDPLSALDSHTGEWVFRHAVIDRLHKRGKTVVLVTHQVQRVSFADQVINMEEFTGGPNDELSNYVAKPSIDSQSSTSTDSFSQTQKPHNDSERKKSYRNIVVDASTSLNAPLLEYDAVSPDSHSIPIPKPNKERGNATYGSVVVDMLEEEEEGDEYRPRSVQSDGSRTSLQRELSDGLVASHREDVYKSRQPLAEDPSGLVPSPKSSKSARETKKDADRRQLLGGLVDDEARDVGAVSWAIYVSYLRSCGVPVAMFVAFLLVLYQAAVIATDFWLSIWSTNELDNTPVFYIIVYGGLALGSIVVLGLTEFVAAVVGIRAAKGIHRRMIDCLLNAPVTFFDTTPTGRIINRVSRDVNTIDQSLFYTVRWFAAKIIQFVGVVAFIIYVTFWFAIAVVPVCLVFFFVQQYYRRTSRELKRLDSVSKSPIFEHFTETLGGLSTIRAFRDEERFTDESMKRVDFNTKPYFLVNALNRWLGTYLDMLGSVVFLCASMSVVLFRDSIGLGLLGLVVSYALNLSGSLNWLVRFGIQTEIDLNAIERTDEYTAIPSEGFVDSKEPHESWPSHGEIEFKAASLRYRPGLPIVLKGIELLFEPGQRVGVCGRTGSGKSSLLVSLFRMVELCSGSIEIDGVDIATIPLQTLRSQLSIIPQDPVLFQGSIRDNLDPFSHYPDDRVWEVLECVRMKDVVVALEGGEGLKSSVGEAGNSFSVGQRQLLCLARAILRGSRILVLDEATSSIDHDTDRLIQTMLREQFRMSTVVTIAHRLDTILDYDRIVVMEDGNVKEFGAPGALTTDATSEFSQLLRKQQANDSGDRSDNEQE